jgi:RNA polymerase sigma-70 factor (ECF subfamily)
LATTTVDIHRELVQQCMQGKRQSFQELYQLYAKAMFNICMRMLGKREDAEDVLQEAFADAFGRIRDFRFESTFGYWIKQITINKCVSALRKRHIDFQEAEDWDAFETLAEENNSRDEFEIELQVAEVKKAMMQLPDGSRSIFSLYLFEGYDHLEIAEILNISESTSKTQYMRARQKVKELLIQREHEKG